MPLQNENQFNTKEFNSFFAPKGDIVAKQLYSREQLLAQQAAVAKRDAGSNGMTGLLVQNSLSEEPVNFAQKNVQNINVALAEKKTYRGLFYSISKTVNYLSMRLHNQFDPNEQWIQSMINIPKNQAIRSRTNTSGDLSKVYNMQFYLNTGPTGNNYLLEISASLPGAVGEVEFIKRLDPAAAEAETLRNMARMGFVDTDFNPLGAAEAEVAATPRTLTINDVTPLEAACKGRS